jgi:diguanylate cyclase (GGDEF)-like protein
MIDPHQSFIRRTMLLVLVCAALGGTFAALVHLRQPQPHPLDLAISIGVVLVMGALAVALALQPMRLLQVVWAAFAAGLVALALPAWIYPLQAIATPGGSLVDTLPPVAAGLLPLILTMIVFLRPRHAFRAALAAWLIVATPILFYLFAHQAELRTPRGLDIAMTLGPVMLMLVVYIPFHRNVERRFSALQIERARMQTLAEHDGLTGLFNRRASEDVLANLVNAREASDALVLFDVDHFKRINDNHGHPVGDEVLRQIARRCEGVLRRDDVLARWGGEEFLLLVRSARGDGIVHVAETLRRAIAEPPIEPVGTVTASFGIAMFHPDDTLQSWLQRADEALYAAKQGGRNRVVMAK